MRHVYLVEPSTAGDWTVKKDGQHVLARSTRLEAVKAAAKLARGACVRKRRPELAELIVRLRSGQFGERRTYGRDPRGSKG
jgi:hypothetical protein